MVQEFPELEEFSGVLDTVPLVLVYIPGVLKKFCKFWKRSKEFLIKFQRSLKRILDHLKRFQWFLRRFQVAQEAQQVLENGLGNWGFLKRYYGYLDGFQELHKSVLMGSLEDIQGYRHSQSTQRFQWFLTRFESFFMKVLKEVPAAVEEIP